MRQWPFFAAEKCRSSWRPSESVSKLFEANSVHTRGVRVPTGENKYELVRQSRGYIKDFNYELQISKSLLRDKIKNVRGVNNLQVPKPNKTHYSKNSVKYLAAITWNKISDTLRSISILSAFKRAIRQLRF